MKNGKNCNRGLVKKIGNMNKKNLIGTFTLNTCPNVTEIISKNLDFIIIDREHGVHGF